MPESGMVADTAKMSFSSKHSFVVKLRSFITKNKNVMFYRIFGKLHLLLS